MKNDYLPCVDDFSEMRTQLKNRDDSLNYIFSALSCGIVGSGQDTAQVPTIFFSEDGAAFFCTDYRPPEWCVTPCTDRCRLPPGGLGGRSGGPYRKFAAYGPFEGKGPSSGEAGCGDFGSLISQISRTGFSFFAEQVPVHS